MQTNPITIQFQHEGFGIVAVGSYYPHIEATFDQPPEYESFEPDAIYVNGVDMLGFQLLNYLELQTLILAEINKEPDV